MIVVSTRRDQEWMNTRRVREELALRIQNGGLNTQHGETSRAGFLRACSHEGGGPQVGEVPRLGGVTNLSIQSLFIS